MDETNESQSTCRMRETDDEGHPNLCCCYIMDDEGNIHDPCYYPADQCC